MKYLKNIDINDCIFVIDSITTALITSIITEGRPCNIILERKKGVEQDNTFLQMKNFIHSSINVKSISEVEVTAPYFIRSYEIHKLIRLKRETKNIYKIYKKNTIFIGPSTSTVMMCLPCGEENIYYIYHGTGDYIKCRGRHRSTVQKIKDFCIDKALQLPNSRWAAFWPKQAFSLCKLNDNNVVWVNYMDFQSQKIEMVLNNIFNCSDNKINVFFCPNMDDMNKNGIDPDTTSYNNFNYKLLSKHIDPNKERVFLKFHPYLYRLRSDAKIDLEKYLEDRNIEAYDIGSMIPDEIGGSLLPIEAIMRYLPFKKLIAVDTSAVWNLSENSAIEKILDISDISEELKASKKSFLPIILSKCNIDSIRVVE
jgi:hypothetical protein